MKLDGLRGEETDNSPHELDGSEDEVPDKHPHKLDGSEIKELEELCVETDNIEIENWLDEENIKLRESDGHSSEGSRGDLSLVENSDSDKFDASEPAGQATNGLDHEPTDKNLGMNKDQIMNPMTKEVSKA